LLKQKNDRRLNNNQLSGMIPTQFVNLTSLYDLYDKYINQYFFSNFHSIYLYSRLQSNQLSGTIPTFVLTLPSYYLWEIFFETNYIKLTLKIFNRYLASNYWDCPIPSYSRSSSDYSSTKSQCGKFLLRFFFF